MTIESIEAANLKLKWSYFNREEPIRFEAGESDYADPEFKVPVETYEWNWSISDIINSLIDAGLQIKYFREYDKIFYPALEGMVREDRFWKLPAPLHGKIPLMFSLKAEKK
ncbi:hypothetical protein K8I28_08455 [bacterium]|nr:hypothetical protein [bacterium]